MFTITTKTFCPTNLLCSPRIEKYKAFPLFYAVYPFPLAHTPPTPTKPTTKMLTPQTTVKRPYSILSFLHIFPNSSSTTVDRLQDTSLRPISISSSPTVFTEPVPKKTHPVEAEDPYNRFVEFACDRDAMILTEVSGLEGLGEERVRGRRWCLCVAGVLVLVFGLLGMGTGLAVYFGLKEAE